MSNRICLAVTDAVSFNTLCRGQLEYFRNNGASLTLLCGGSDEEVSHLMKRDVGVVVSVPLVRKPSLLVDLRCFIKLLIYFKNNKFDSVMYSTPKAMLLVGLAAFLSRGAPRRIMLIRGRAYENMQGLKKRVFIFLDKLVVRASTSVLAISKSLADVCVKDFRIDPAQIDVLGAGSSNGIDTEKFSPLNNKLPREDKRYVVAIVGRLCVDKGIADVGMIVEQLLSTCPGKIEFRFFGRIEDSVAMDFKTKFSNNPYVFFFGKVNDINVRLKDVDLHLFLSFREGFGNVAVEAAATGVPTLAYSVVGVKDSVSDGVSGKLFKYRDWNSIAKFIEQTVLAEGDFSTQFPAARAWAVSMFNQDVIWDAYFRKLTQK